MVEHEKGFAKTPQEAAQGIIAFEGQTTKVNTVLYNLFDIVDYDHIKMESGKFQFPGTQEEIRHDGIMFAREFRGHLYNITSDEFDGRSRASLAREARQKALAGTPFTKLLALTAINDESLAKAGVEDEELREALSNGALDKEMEMRKAVIRRSFSANKTYRYEASIPELQADIQALQRFQYQLTEKTPNSDPSPARRR